MFFSAKTSEGCYRGVLHHHFLQSAKRLDEIFQASGGWAEKRRKPRRPPQDFSTFAGMVGVYEEEPRSA